MRISQWGRKRSHQEAVMRGVIRTMEERGQLLVLVGFLLLLALVSSEVALGWLVGGMLALVTFHASTRSILQAHRLEPAENRRVRRRAFRRRVFLLAAVVLANRLVAAVDGTALLTGLCTLKLALYFLAPRHLSWRAATLV